MAPPIVIDVLLFFTAFITTLCLLWFFKTTKRKVKAPVPNEETLEALDLGIFGKTVFKKFHWDRTICT